MEEKSIVSGRGKTFYWTKKSAGPSARSLVFLPGLTADHSLFEPQTHYFAGKYNVLVWDAPAHGKSRPYRDFSYPHLAGELKTLLEAEGVEKAVLIGQSAGGFVAQSFIAAYPETAEGLLAIGTCPYGTEYYSRSDLFWLKQTEWMLKLFPGKTLKRSIAKLCGASDAGVENMLHMLEGYEKRELCHLMYLGFAGFIPELRDLDIPCPVCLLVGDWDKTGKVRKYNERWHKKTGYPLHVIPGASHNANVDKPEEVNRIIEAFVNDLDRIN